MRHTPHTWILIHFAPHPLLCRARGGLDAERTERARIKEEAAARDRRNFEWMQALRREGFRKRRAMLGLPDGDTDPFFDTLPTRSNTTTTATDDAAKALQMARIKDGQSSGKEDDGSDVESLLADPPELEEARRKLAAYSMHVGDDNPSKGACG
jgi:hypothetical protein